jgi:hypothetical protein
MLALPGAAGIAAIACARRQTSLGESKEAAETIGPWVCVRALCAALERVALQ